MIQSSKIMLLGEIGVGKTSLARRFVFNRFDSSYKSTIGVDIMTHDAELTDQKKLRLILWDTDGEFGLKIFDTVYVKGAAGALIISDATRPHTLSRAVVLAQQFGASFPGRPIRIIVNKIDLQDMPLDAFKEATLAPGDALRASALTGEGVGAAFISMGEDILRRGF